MARPPDSVADADRAFLERLVARCRDDDRVAALFLGGSHASGTADGYSDLDLYLITTDGGFDDLRDERHELLHALGDAVFLEEHEDFGFLMLLYMYADGVHGEIALAPARDLAEVHAGPYVALLDRSGLLADRRFPAWRSGDDDRKDLIRRLLVWFWYDRRLLDVALHRGELWTAHHYLERCRRTCADLARLRTRPEEWPSGYEKVERVVEAAILDRLAETVVPLDADAAVLAVRSLTEIYREIGREVAAMQGVDYPDRIDELLTREG